MKKTQIKYNKNNIDIILNIESKEKITNDLINNIKNMIHNNQLLYIENNDGIAACDTHIFNTCYNMFNIKIIPTYTEENEKEKIIKIEFYFNIFKNDKIVNYNKNDFLKNKILFESVIN